MNGGLAQAARLLRAADADARPFARETFEAWRVSPDNPRGEALPLKVGDARTVKEAVNAATTANFIDHKDTLVVLVTDHVANKRMAHFHAIKRKSQPRYVHGEDGVRKPVRDLYAVELFAMAFDTFVPIEPFDALRCCPVGVDRSIVEQIS